MPSRDAARRPCSHEHCICPACHRPSRPRSAAPEYTLLLSTDPDLVEEAQRLRYDVFTSEPGFALDLDRTDADRFDEFCDHLLVREDNTGELVGCYRMLPPPGAIAAGGLVHRHRVRRPRRSIRCGRRWSRWAAPWSATITATARVVLLMWAGILAYLDRCGYDYVTGCVSVPLTPRPAACAGLRAAAVSRRAYTGAAVPAGAARRRSGTGACRGAVPLMRGYLRLGARVCGEPAHDPDFGVGDFLALLDKRQADTRYLKRLRSVAAATEAVR